jgi:membrane fusion protein, multidrug efflux system
MKRKLIIWSILLIVILSALLIPRVLSNKNQGGGPPQDGKGLGKTTRAVAVSVQIAELSSIEEKVLMTGTIHASKDIELRNETSGRVTEVNFKEGMLVKKGQLLVKLNDNDLQAQLLKAQASLKLTQDKEQRQKGLLEKEIISVEENQNSVKDRESAEADVQLLKAQIEKTKIIAPFTGMIGLSSVSEGTFLNTGSKIANLVSINELEIECNITERHAQSLNKGKKLTFTLPGNQTIYNAEIYAIEPKIDDATRTIGIKARCLDNDSRLTAGSFVKIEIIVNQHKGIMVPGNALISDIEGYKIFKVKNNQSLPIIVNTGFRDEKNVEIISGIKPGDTLITTGAFMLRPKSKIEIQGTAGDRHR